jgi:hypothetical protein
MPQFMAFGKKRRNRGCILYTAIDSAAVVDLERVEYSIALASVPRREFSFAFGHIPQPQTLFDAVTVAGQYDGGGGHFTQ